MSTARGVVRAGEPPLGTGGRPAAIRVLRREGRITIVHHHDERGTWATRGREILFQGPRDSGWERLARFPRASALDALVALRPSCRALRLDRCNVLPTRSGALLGIRAGRVYRIEAGSCVPLGAIQGDCVMNRAIAETADGWLYFGEYCTNSARRPIRIWRIDPGLSRLEPVHELAEPRIRHVHAIHLDPWEPQRLWFTTGDFEGECHLGYSDDGFASVRLLGDGGQRYRAVGLLFFAERIAWLTDSEIAGNRVVSLDRRTGELSEHAEVATSAWYALRTSDGLHLATTTVEPGPSIRTRRACLLCSADGLAWKEAASFEKDAWPMPWFKFGSLSLPSGSMSSRSFWLSGEGLVGLDGASLLCALERPERGA